MSPINVIIAHASSLFAEYLALLFGSEATFRVSARVTDSRTLLALVDTHRPDIVLSGPHLPGGDAAEAVQALKERYPATNILVLALPDDDEAIRVLIRAGASGFVCIGSTGYDEIVQAIRAVHAGRSWLPRTLASQAPCPCLNKKELEILHLVCCQKSSKQIADEVGLTRRSVEVYRNKINEKIGVSNAVGAALYAVKHGIFKF